MNLAFWIIVLILIGLFWFGLSSIFGNVGGIEALHWALAGCLGELSDYKEEV